MAKKNITANPSRQNISQSISTSTRENIISGISALALLGQYNATTKNRLTADTLMIICWAAYMRQWKILLFFSTVLFDIIPYLYTLTMELSLEDELEKGITLLNGDIEPSDNLKESLEIYKKAASIIQLYQKLDQQTLFLDGFMGLLALNILPPSLNNYITACIYGLRRHVAAAGFIVYNRHQNQDLRRNGLQLPLNYEAVQQSQRGNNPFRVTRNFSGTIDVSPAKNTRLSEGVAVFEANITLTYSCNGKKYCQNSLLDMSLHILRQNIIYLNQENNLPISCALNPDNNKLRIEVFLFPANRWQGFDRNRILNDIFTTFKQQINQIFQKALESLELAESLRSKLSQCNGIKTDEIDFYFDRQGRIFPYFFVKAKAEKQQPLLQQIKNYLDSFNMGLCYQRGDGLLFDVAQVDKTLLDKLSFDHFNQDKSTDLQQSPQTGPVTGASSSFFQALEASTSSRPLKRRPKIVRETSVSLKVTADLTEIPTTEEPDFGWLNEILQNQDVYPVRSTRNQYAVFMLSNIGKTNLSDRDFLHLQSLFSGIKMASPRGESGLIILNSNDPLKISYPNYQVKFKPLGIHGDTRALGMRFEIPQPYGDTVTVYVITALVLDAHKASKKIDQNHDIEAFLAKKDTTDYTFKLHQ